MSRSLLLLAALAALCLSALGAGPVHTIPLARRASGCTSSTGEALLPKMASAVTSLKHKYALNSKVLISRRKAYEQTGCRSGASFAKAFTETLASELEKLLRTLTGGLLRHKRMERVSHSKRASSLVQAGKLTDKENDSYWTGYVKIGSPARQYSIDFDTGSTDFIVCGSSDCTSDDRVAYNTSASRTAVDTDQSFRNSYGDGSTTSGSSWNDTVRFGKLKATDQQISVATSMGGSLSTMEADGLMGFAFPTLSSLAEGQSFPATLAAQGAIESEVFAFRLDNGTAAGAGGQLYMGGYDKSQSSGNLTWYEMGTDTYNYEGEYSYFQIHDSNAYINGHEINRTATSFIIDTGSTLMIAPKSAAAAFYAAIPGSKVLGGEYEGEGYYTYPCATPPSVAFAFGGNNATLQAVDDYTFNFGTVNGDTDNCVGALVGQDAGLGNSWILGDVFLRNHYSVFDVANKKIGFADLA